MNRLKTKAQAVTELAIFGAILIFVIGGILRNSVDAGMNQFQSLKAMRWAMLQSLYGVRNGTKSRTTASVIFIEDRLSPDAGKVGSLERSPTVQVSSGTFTNTLFMPLDWLEYQNIPLTDLFVNGTHFTLSTARFIVYDIRLDPNNASQMRVWDLTNNVIKYYPRGGNWLDDCLPGPIGCPIFQQIIASNSSKFCATQAACIDATITAAQLDQRFDLNRNDVYSDDPAGPALRGKMSWQWIATSGLNSKLGVNADTGVYPTFDIDLDRKEESVYAINPNSLWDKTGPNYNVQLGAEPLVSREVDMTALEAASIVWQDVLDDNGVVIGQEIVSKDVAQQVYVLDFNQGDIDGTFDDTDRLNRLANSLPDVERGLQRATSVYSQTKDGTYLEINEGRAFVPTYSGTGEYVRSTSKKDQIDVISRTFQMDNNTGRFCGTESNTRWVTIGNQPGGFPNPVQYCVNSSIFQAANCFTPATVSTTCYDAGTKVLFVRSRIEDKSGRRWATQTK